MKTLSKPALSTFNKLLQMAEANGNYIKVDNTNGDYMPVSIEILSENESFKFVSVAHYYEQNGDLMADPSMTFAIPKYSLNDVFPIETRMDGLNIYKEYVQFENEKVKSFIPALQYDAATFCTMWFRNIKNQQRIK